MNGEPTISVVIPTCNRPQDVERCLESLTSVSYPDWDILLVDQSDGGETREVAAGFTSRLPQFTYQHMSEKGTSRARNLGMRTVRGDIVAFIDDDCPPVSPDWLHHVADAFARHPDAALVFGCARPVPHDASKYWIYSYEVPEERVLRGHLALLNVGGGGGSMYLRRRVYRDVGPMDIYAGPGARFPSAEDRDYAYRLLAFGFTVVETPTIVVEHYGARAYDSGAVSRAVRDGGYSQGAVDMKHLRCGEPVALLLILRRIVRNSTKLARGIISRQRPGNLGWFVMYLCGLLASFQLPVIRRYRVWGLPNEYDLADLLHDTDAYDGALPNLDQRAVHLVSGQRGLP